MTITLTGATGFLGKAIRAALEAGSLEVRALGRQTPSEECLAGSSAVIHLAGEPIAQRWTAEAKARIRASRVDGTRRLVEALSTLSPRPEVLVCASAIGYYGDRREETLTEDSAPGQGFLADTCAAWEQTADLALSLGIRVVRLRFGVVLGSGGGALSKMLFPFRLGLGGPLAGGAQWMSWVHIDDAVRMACWAASNQQVRGAVNAVAPAPVRNAEFTRILAKTLRRPAVFPVPALSLRLLYGEMASILTGSQKVLPEAALRAGFTFCHPDLGEALRALL
ncbi:MAG: TIGR01777 family protein [Candidatus Solibacter usitatus]|nr:TIGR01777 family protein [Candidatus Solibacter usitatus]